MGWDLFNPKVQGAGPHSFSAVIVLLYSHSSLLLFYCVCVCVCVCVISFLFSPDIQFSHHPHSPIFLAVPPGHLSWFLFSASPFDPIQKQTRLYTPMHYADTVMYKSNKPYPSVAFHKYTFLKKQTKTKKQVRVMSRNMLFILSCCFFHLTQFFSLGSSEGVEV
jgi:hypothetical protein